MIVAVIPDRFSKAQSDRAGQLTGADGMPLGLSDVRRPTRGIQLKNDTYARLKVLRGDGTEIPLVNAGSRNGTLNGNVMKSESYANFLIQSVSEDRMEKQQVVETFGEAYIFFFGERPRVINVQGVLINTFDFNWEAEWWHNYDNYLRGTKCVENDARVFLTYDETLVSGYILTTSSSKTSQERNHVPFMFQLFVTDYSQISKVGNPDPDQRKIPPYQGNLSKYETREKYGPMRLPFRDQSILNLSSASQKLSLVESLAQTGLSAVRQTMTAARELANAALVPAAYLDRFLGNPVRVPVGFQGAVALDETKVNLSTDYPGLDYPIGYTTSFGDNSDEFVSLNSSYVGSEIRFTDAANAAFAQGSSVGASAAVMLANSQWKARGLLPPTDDVSKLLTKISQNPIGMKVLGSARNWLATKGEQVSSKTNAVLDQNVQPYADGAQQLLYTTAVADNLLGIVSPSSSQAVDRAITGEATVNASANFSAAVQKVEVAKKNSLDSFKSFANTKVKNAVGGG